MDATMGISLDPTTGNLSFPTSVRLEKFMELTEDIYETWAHTAKANLVVAGYSILLLQSTQTMHSMLQHHLNDVDIVGNGWDILQNKFREGGMVGQLNLLHTALHTHFTWMPPKIIIKIHELNSVINPLS